jgi:hypothetical protein
MIASVPADATDDTAGNRRVKVADAAGQALRHGRAAPGVIELQSMTMAPRSSASATPCENSTSPTALSSVSIVNTTDAPLRCCRRRVGNPRRHHLRAPRPSCHRGSTQ